MTEKSDHHDANRPLVAGITFIAMVLLGYVLHVGADILVPLAVAVIVWYLINALISLFGRVKLGEYKLPGWLRMVLAITTLVGAIALIVSLVSTNIVQLSLGAPKYQANLQDKINGLLALVGLSDQMPDFGQMIADFNYAPYITSLAGALTGIAGKTGLILVYVIFLLLEQRVFNAKFAALFGGEGNGESESARAILRQIQGQIKQYLSVKTAVSLATGAVSYGVLKVVGVDYAAFWAFLIFLLNFIPTIGSMIAVIFPALMALLQFDTYSQPLILLGVLAGIQFLFGNIIEPRFMGNSLNLSPLVIILALALWGSLWGIVGMFLCVPLTVITLIALSHFETTRWIAVMCTSRGELAESA